MVLLSLVASLFAAAVSAVSINHISIDKGRTHLRGAYIFEFDDENDRADFFTLAATNGWTRMEFNYTLFKGASVQFKDIDRAEELANKMLEMPVVKRIWPIKMHSLPELKIDWTGNPGKDYRSMKKSSAQNSNEDTFNPHVMTQVDKLRKKGYTGKGVKIAVIDSGVDYKHPALGGCFGPGCLVTIGADLVGDDYDGYNNAYPDGDPMDCQGHGTHVAGIIAAQENPMGFTGAAPDVSLHAYRTFGCSGEAADDILIAAFNMAYKGGADIITASVGSPGGWSEDAWATAVSRIVDKGVPCLLAAGNYGDAGMFYASTPASGKGVAGLASFNTNETPTILNVSTYSIGNGSSKNEFTSLVGFPNAWTGVKLPLWASTYDTMVKDDGCSAYPKNTTNLSGYIVLVRQGTCTVVEKAVHAANAGAKYILIYSDKAGVDKIQVASVEGIQAAGMVKREVGEEWISLLKAGFRVVLDMGGGGGRIILDQTTNNVTGGAVSIFSSWGPTWEMDVKPQFGAPGGGIISTYPRSQGSYAIFSGTSMATPLVAGIYALIFQIRGTVDPELIENLLSATSNPQRYNDGSKFYPFLAPVPQQGAGLVQAHDAAYANVLLSPSNLSFNDTDHFNESRNFTLTNLGQQHVSFNISHVPAVTAYTLGENTIYPESFPNEFASMQATLRFSQSKLTLFAGQSATIRVVATPPANLRGSRLPVWSGYIAINGTDGSSLSIPYQGLTGSLHNSTVLASNDTWISNSTDENLTAVPRNTGFILPKPNSTNKSSQVTTMDDNVYPQLVWFLALGSPILLADVVPVRSNLSTPFDRPRNGSIGQVADFPKLWNSMGSDSASWTGQLADGTYAPAGVYKIVYRALRIFGDEKKYSDWDKSETLPFRIRYE